jgi:hypothetical protein
MIVTQLIGGLGNQLFQYSVGRCLAEKNRTRLKLDASAFATYRLRTFALSHFSIEADVLTHEEVLQLGESAAPKRRLAGILERLWHKSPVPVVAERSFAFDPRVMDATAPCYLKGYWQSPKYFAPIEPLIRSELQVRDPLSGENSSIADRIASTLAVSLHVRRGDYVTNAVTARYHGVCGPEYFYAAEALLQRSLGRFTLFVFSDDPVWAERNLQFRSPALFVRHNGPGQDYEDLRLMTMCRHHIIANSTFSWWGAWLCRHPDKTVIAPKNWFREAGHRADDLIPANWIRI